MADSVLTFRPSASYDEALARASETWGIEPEYWDIWGRHHVPSPEAQRAVLRSFGVASDTREQLDGALEERLWAAWSRLAPPTVVAGAERAVEIEVHIPAELAGGVLSAELVWESGESAAVETPAASPPLVQEAELRGRRFVGKKLALPFAPRLGYHELRLAVRERGREAFSVTRLILAPGQAWLPPRLEQGGRAAGL
ncbi:MAG: hypothetical protein HY822_07360, partial [Acidobacteria bacterium]|nr:hypothetical protein [Acidobacteriota bacterium]